jgi:hypothetical protein
MGGWLDLAQQGLSPCKKYQALLGALTVREVPKSGYYSHILSDLGTSLLGDVSLFKFSSCHGWQPLQNSP